MKNIYLKHIDISNAIVPALAIAHDWDEANRFIENGYTRIGRKAWREYKRAQREAQVQRNMNKVIAEHAQESALHDLVKETEAERMMSEEPYL